MPTPARARAGRMCLAQGRGVHGSWWKLLGKRREWMGEWMGCWESHEYIYIYITIYEMDQQHSRSEAPVGDILICFCETRIAVECGTVPRCFGFLEPEACALVGGSAVFALVVELAPPFPLCHVEIFSAALRLHRCQGFECRRPQRCGHQKDCGLDLPAKSRWVWGD